MSGTVAYHSGRVAEDSVARHYERRGFRVLRRRWRGRGGELDLVLQSGDDVVFVEVKKARNHAGAAARVGRRQVERLLAAAAEYLGTAPMGQLTPARFDVATVDATGRIEILENALAA